MRIALRFLPALLWMGVIYRTSDTPGLKSVPLVQRVGLLPADLDPATLNLLELLIRKSAHLLSYALLAWLLLWALSAVLGRRQALWTAFGLALLYAASDELHQAFVPMREGRLTDVLIDAVGAALGLGAAFWRAASPLRSSIWWKAMLTRILLWFLGRGICACAALDSRVQAEVHGWADGVRIMMEVDPTGPAMALEKRGGRLRFLGVREVVSADLVIAFKHLDGALPVLLGLVSVARGYAERRMTMRGDIAFGMSVVRVMLLVEAYLFPGLITRRIMQRVPAREVSMARIYLSTLLAPHGR